MRRIRTVLNCSPRRGITRIEVIVVVAIAVLVVTLVTRGIQDARQTSRRMQCLCRMKSVCLALHNFAAQTGHLSDLTVDIPADDEHVIYGAGWPIALLPALDSTKVLREIKRNHGHGASSAQVPSSAVIETLPEMPDELYTCVDDVDSAGQPGGLSFVLNGGIIASTLWGTESPQLDPDITPHSDHPATTGLVHQPYFIDWNADRRRSNDGITPLRDGDDLDAFDRDFELATGVIFRPTVSPDPNAPPSAGRSLDDISAGDGTSTTLLITENLNAGRWTGSTDSPHTKNFGVNHIAFGIPIPVDSDNAPIAGLFRPGTLTTTTGPGSLTDRTTNDGATNNAQWHINSNRHNKIPGSQPRPSSNHAGGVNAMLCDGSGKFLSEKLDPQIYIKLLTSNGAAHGEGQLNPAGF